LYNPYVKFSEEPIKDSILRFSTNICSRVLVFLKAVAPGILELLALCRGIRIYKLQFIYYTYGVVRAFALSAKGSSPLPFFGVCEKQVPAFDSAYAEWRPRVFQIKPLVGVDCNLCALHGFGIYLVDCHEFLGFGCGNSCLGDLYNCDGGIE
jgi:hypothetical protein